MYVCVHEHVCACVCMYVLMCYGLNPGVLGKCSPTVTDPQPQNVLTFFPHISYRVLSPGAFMLCCKRLHRVTAKNGESQGRGTGVDGRVGRARLPALTGLYHVLP